MLKIKEGSQFFYEDDGFIGGKYGLLSMSEWSFCELQLNSPN